MKTKETSFKLDTEAVLSRYPKVRKPLPDAYQKIYEEYYVNNRNGQTAASFFSRKVDGWAHRKVAKDVRKAPGLTTLEIGAGTLNQLIWEPTEIYDIVEPFQALYLSSKYLNRIRNIYADINEIEGVSKYDRITAIGSFEHICNLPEVVERCQSLLRTGGSLRVAIPSEGKFLWKFSYTITTGLEFKLKYGLDYSVIMNHEHVSTADEIEAVLAHFFPHIKMSLLGVSKNLSVLRYYECVK